MRSTRFDIMSFLIKEVKIFKRALGFAKICSKHPLKAALWSKVFSLILRAKKQAGYIVCSLLRNSSVVSWLWEVVETIKEAVRKLSSPDAPRIYHHLQILVKLLYMNNIYIKVFSGFYNCYNKLWERGKWW